jgi:meso-butanediol dehydrogenase/(S,S)-butanediol dehydrogenase/diacetyl reductase
LVAWATTKALVKRRGTVLGTHRPADVGDLAVYLASDRSSFLTGEIIVLDGGRTAQLPLPS